MRSKKKFGDRPSCQQLFPTMVLIDRHPSWSQSISTTEQCSVLFVIQAGFQEAAEAGIFATVREDKVLAGIGRAQFSGCLLTLGR